MSRGLIAVVDVIHEMGVEPEPRLMWSVGGTLARAYLKRTGQWPVQRRHMKTHGAGTHCMAHYPSSWKRRIRDEITKALEAGEATTRKQGELFA